jgi:hypothetical protein
MATARTLASSLEMSVPLLKPLVDNMRTVDNVLSFFLNRAEVTDRGQIVINRISSVPAAQVIDCDSTITSIVGATTKVTVDPSNYVSQFDICEFVENQASSFEDQIEVDSKIAMKAIAAQLGSNIFTGSGTTGGVNGMNGYVGTSYATAVSGSLALSDLNTWEANLTNVSPNDVYITGPAVYAKIGSLLNAAGGATMTELARGYTVLAYHGVPVLSSQYAPAGTMFRINPDEGYKLVYQQKANSNVGPFQLKMVAERTDKAAQVYRVGVSMFGISESTQGVTKLTGC